MKMFSLLVFSLVLAASDSFILQPKIINASLSDPADYPFYVYMRIERDGSTFGGTLLSDRY